MSDPGDGTPPGDDDAAGPRTRSASPSAASARRPPSCSARSPTGPATRAPTTPGGVRARPGPSGTRCTSVDEHIATGSADCRYCPVCQVIHVVRETSPEVRTHLAMAAGSLMNAAAGLLATQAQRPRPPGVEKIDLDDASPWDDER